MKWESVIPILVALLGIGSALVTGYLAGRNQARLDYQKEARLAVAQLAKSIGVAVHTISWFTWKAKHRGSLLAKKDAEDYDNAMKEIFPDLTGSLATLAAFSPAAYTRANPPAAARPALPPPCWSAKYLTSVIRNGGRPVRWDQVRPPSWVLKSPPLSLART